MASKKNGRKVQENITFRLDASAMRTIRRDSMDQGFTLNSLVNRQLLQYTEWDRLERKIGFTTVSYRFFRSVLERLPDDEIAALGKAQGPVEAREYILLRWRTVTFENFLRFVENYSKFATQYDLEKHPGEARTVVLVHALGEKWSIYLEAFMVSALEALFGIQPASERTDNSVLLTLPPADTGGA